MPRNPLKLKIAYLYPDVLESNCDRANVETFYYRANWRGIDVSVHEIFGNDKIQSARYDFYYIGGSNTQALSLALKYLQQNEDELRIAAYSSVPMLAVNCGYMLFGNFYQLHNQVKMEGLQILDVDSIAGKSRHFGNIYGNCPFLRNRIIAGFENHSMITYLKSGAGHFFTVKSGLGNNGKDKTEGARFKNVIGTYLISPILAQNPHFCDFLIAKALRVKYRCKIPLTKLTDDIEWYSHNYIIDSK